MNSALKTTLIVIAVVLVGWAIFALNGWHFSNQSSTLDYNYNATSTDGSSTSTDVSGKKVTSSNTSDNSNASNPYHSSTGTQNTGLSDSALAMAISNTLIRVPQTGVDVAPTSGEADFTDSSTKGHVSIGRVLGKVATDNGYDVFVEMTMTIQGRPTIFHYVSLFHNVGQSVVYTSSVNIGDRLVINNVVATADQSAVYKAPQSFMTSSLPYNLTVSYLDRKVGEPLTTAPSVSRTVTLRVVNHTVSK